MQDVSGDTSLPVTEAVESAFEQHRNALNHENIEENCIAHAAASQEWADVATIEPQFGNAAANPAANIVSPPITVTEAFEYFRGMNLTANEPDAISPVERRGFCTMVFSCILGPPQLRDNLISDRDLIYAITKCDLCAEDPVHWRMLQTVFRHLTGDLLDCPRFGAHWQAVGFQGTDPGTDFRGVGMLGLLQLVHLATSERCRRFAARLYRVSLDQHQNFPLAVLSLNITCLALQALKQGQLNRECNRRHSVLDVLNDFYVAAMYRFLEIYTTQNKTIRDTGYLLKDVETYCRGNVQATLTRSLAKLDRQY